MEYLKQKVFSLTERFFQRGEPPVEYSRKEAYLNFTHKVLVWDDPGLTWVVVLVFNVVFGIIVHLEVRIFSVIFYLLLAAFVLDAYTEQLEVKEARTSSSDKLRKVYDVLVELRNYLMRLREENPSAFCISLSVFFLLTAYIGRTLSGQLIFYLCMLAVFFGPLVVSKIPDKYIESFIRGLQVFSRDEGVFSELELIPNITNNEVNEKDVDLDSLTDKTGDSVTNSLISGITSMPSHLDIEGDADILEEEDLQPSVSSAQASLLSRIPAVEYSSDSDESEHRYMEFKSSHFNPDSSSEEESSYTKGLNFTDAKDLTHEGQDAGVSSFGGILSNLGSIGSVLVSNVMKSKEPAKKQDSDSDFEIINNDELDEQ